MISFTPKNKAFQDPVNYQQEYWICWYSAWHAE